MQKNPETRFLLSAPASGAAVILKKRHNENRMLNLAFATDADMADEVFVPGGGTEHPYAADNLDSKIIYYQTQKPGLVAEYLHSRWRKRLAGLVQMVSPHELPDFLALRHLSKAERAEILSILGVPPERSPAHRSIRPPWD